jgi:transcriptional regulator with XRE-family HTH domain
LAQTSFLLFYIWAISLAIYCFMKNPKLSPSDLDDRLSLSSSLAAKLTMPPEGWLRAVRDGLGMSQREAAAAAGVTQQAFDQFESGELRASITLERLQKAAGALGCEVVYFLQPAKSHGGSFAALAERRVRRQNGGGKAPRVLPREDDELPVNLL